MKNRQFLRIIFITILFILCTSLGACGGGEAESEPEETRSSEPNTDYVYCHPDPEDCDNWTLRIIIPEKENEFEVYVKEPLDEEDLSEFDTEEFTPLEDKLIINFCIKELGNETDCIDITEGKLNLPMSIEVKFDQDTEESEAKLGYAVVDNEEKQGWVLFKYQWKCDGVAVALTSEWAKDPQVAWGY